MYAVRDPDEVDEKRAPVRTLRHLRSALAALTDALEKRDPFAERIFLDPETLTVVVDSSLDDAERRPEARGAAISCPDGLWEWQLRRDFVRSLPPGRTKTRLGATLGGPKTRRRFEVTLAAAGGRYHSDFKQWRRRRLRGYAARVLRVALMPHAARAHMSR